MTTLKNEKQLAKFTYKFARDGGAVGAIALKPEVTPLKEGMIITDVYLKEVVPLSASGTVDLGLTGDADGLMESFKTALAAKKSLRAGEVDGDLVFDSTDAKLLLHEVANNTTNVLLNVGTAALTAGELVVYVEFFSR
jgi:hypothetical protein